MSEGKKEVAPLLGNLGPFVLGPLAEALNAGLLGALVRGVPPHDVIGMLLNQVASAVAHIEPSGVRSTTLKQIMVDLPNLVQQHLDSRHMSPGGVYVTNTLALKNGKEAAA